MEIEGQDILNNSQELDLELIRKTSNFQLLVKQAVSGFINGIHRSPYHGFSVEFAEYKQYNQGESTRFIDWKLFQKTDKLFTKSFQEETNLRCMILLDNSSSMHYPSASKGKLVFSCFTAACIAQILGKQRDATGLTIYSDGIEYQSSIKSTNLHLSSVFQKLNETIQTESFNKQTVTSKVIHQIAEKINRRSLIVLFTDLFNNTESIDEVFEALLHLKYNKNEVILFHVTDPTTEMDLEFENNNPHHFIDIETGETIKVRPNDIKETFAKHQADFYKKIEIKCGQAKIDFINVDIRKSIDQVLYPFLLRRSKLY